MKKNLSFLLGVSVLSLMSLVLRPKEVSAQAVNTDSLKTACESASGYHDSSIRAFFYASTDL